MGSRTNSVEFLARNTSGDRSATGRLLERCDAILEELARMQPDEIGENMLRGHLTGLIEAIGLITFASEADVKEALRRRWADRHAAAS